jgi:hypothetical protein
MTTTWSTSHRWIDTTGLCARHVVPAIDSVTGSLNRADNAMALVVPLSVMALSVSGIAGDRRKAKRRFDLDRLKY